MKFYRSAIKSRVDLYDPDQLDSIHRLTVLPFPEEWSLLCPLDGRRECLTYYAVNSWGELCHINVELQPVASGRMFARATFTLKLNEIDVLQSVEEEILELDQLRDPSGDIKKFRIGALLVEIRRPFQCVRIVFRGFVHSSNGATSKFAKVHLFAFAISKVFDNLTDCDEEFRTKQASDKKQVFCVDSLEQWIQLKGTIELEGFEEPKELFFWGLMIKSFEQEEVRISHLLGWNHKGMGFHLAKVDSPVGGHVYGHINMGLNFNYPIQELPTGLDKWSDFESVKNLQLNVNLIRENRKYDVQFKDAALQVGKEMWMVPVKIQEYDGNGIVWNQNIDQSLQCSLSLEKPLSDIMPAATDAYILSLSDNGATLEALTGGKGSSLAVLRKFSQESAHKFQVPEAVIVTSEAYKLFLDSNPDLKKEVDSFGKRILDCRGNTEKIEEECSRIQDKVNSKSLPESLVNILKQKMFDVFDSSSSDASYAVRSSAVGEDSAEMSAAGQMTTFLGVKNFTDICQSIVACWASQFSLTAVEYKRGYGQSIHSAMAVVVQQMVDCEVAGVMFTCDPLTGNPRYLSITGSFGLGESVVSALVDPDEYKVELDVEAKSFTVREVTDVRVGAKKVKISLAGERTEHLEVADSERTARCLTDEQVLELARIGTSVQHHYGNSRDIEWGIKDGHWFLLQSRPVTNLESLIEWEIIHELDTGHVSENELLSRANVGEVLHGSGSYMSNNIMSRLWHSTTFSFSSKLAGKSLDTFNPYFNPSFASLYGLAFLPLKSEVGLMGRKSADDDSGMIRGSEFQLYGHKNTHRDVIVADVMEKLPSVPMSASKGLRVMWDLKTTIFSSHDGNIEAYKKFAEFKFDLDSERMTSVEILDLFEAEICNISEVYVNHIQVTNTSMFMNALFYGFIESKCNLTNENEILGLFSKITSSVDDVFSAKVPQKLEEISQELENDSNFLELNNDDALEYLKKNYETFNQFLRDYGHRGYNEFDVYYQQWEDNPVTLVESLKSSLSASRSSSNKSKKEGNSHDRAYNLSDYGLSFLQRLFLNYYFIPRIHQGIRDRELGKNLLIRTVHQVRKLLYTLGDKLVEEGKLPQRELLFFMLMPEAVELVRHPTNPLTIINAKNRFRLFAKKNTFKFDEESWGYDIKPKNLLPKQPIPEGAVQLKGTPVSSGRVVARCCVAETLAEAKNIQKGDILITYSTDIGWSPYFAALSGLVTEIGGLVSHGAVIAREYGLPCLVGVEDATLRFTTGETLLLDSAAGFVTRIDATEGEEVPESE